MPLVSQVHKCGSNLMLLLLLMLFLLPHPHRIMGMLDIRAWNTPRYKTESSFSYSVGVNKKQHNDNNTGLLSKQKYKRNSVHATHIKMWLNDMGGGWFGENFFFSIRCHFENVLRFHSISHSHLLTHSMTTFLSPPSPQPSKLIQEWACARCVSKCLIPLKLIYWINSHDCGNEILAHWMTLSHYSDGREM